MCMLVGVLLLPLSLAMDDNGFNHGGGGGGGGSPAAVAAAAAAVVAVDDRDWWQWCLMAVAALDRSRTKTSRRSNREAQQEDERVAQGEAMQQQTNLLLHRHYNMRRCHPLRRHGVTRHRCPPHRHGNMRRCLQPHRHGNRLGWEFQFLVPISGTPIGSGIPIVFSIPVIPVGFVFELRR
jgi:hypothetical protein